MLSLTIFVMGATSGLSIGADVAQSDIPAPSVPIDVATMQIGQSSVFDFDGLQATAVGDPTVADIVPIDKRRLLVNAKGVGRTTVFAFDQKGKHVIDVTVTAQASDLESVMNLTT